MNLEKTPQKQILKRTYTKRCQDKAFELSPSKEVPEKSWLQIEQLQERVKSLEHVVEALLEPLSEQEDSMGSTQEEEEQN